MVAAFAEASSFEPTADVRLGQGVCKFFDADDEDGFDGCDVPDDLGEAVAVAKEGHDHAVGVQIAVDLVGCLYFCEVLYLLAKNLFWLCVPRCPCRRRHRW